MTTLGDLKRKSGAASRLVGNFRPRGIAPVQYVMTSLYLDIYFCVHLFPILLPLQHVLPPNGQSRDLDVALTYLSAVSDPGEGVGGACVLTLWPSLLSFFMLGFSPLSTGKFHVRRGCSALLFRAESLLVCPRLEGPREVDLGGWPREVKGGWSVCCSEGGRQCYVTRRGSRGGGGGDTSCGIPCAVPGYPGKVACCVWA